MLKPLSLSIGTKLKRIEEQQDEMASYKHTNVAVKDIVNLDHCWRKDIQCQQTFSAASADNQKGNYFTEGSNHHTSLSILSSKGFSRSKMVSYIHTDLPVNV